MKYEPLVTIVIPVYNGSNYLKYAIDSAINQDYANKEIIVVNDGSNDNGATEAVVKGYGDKVRYYYKSNGGVSSAINVAINEMKGEYLSWLSHDDIYKTNKISRQIEYLNELLDSNQVSNPYSSCIYCCTERVNKDGKFISRRRYRVKEQASTNEQIIYNIAHYSICGCTVLIPRIVLLETGGFDESLRTVSDADLWFRMMFNGHRFVFMNEVLVQSRQHREQVGNRSLELFKKEHESLMVKIANRVVNDKWNEVDKKRMLRAMSMNGHFEATKIIYLNLNENGEMGIIDRVHYYCIPCVKYVIMCIMRKIYRFITLK